MLFSVNALSQTWAPSGATWHYRADGGYYVFTYSGDTVLSFVNCKVIEKRFIFDNSWGTGIDTLTNYEYMYADTDRVYIYRFNAFQVLYDFSAVVGDTLTVPGTNHYTGCDSTGLVRVDTTGTMVINGQTLRFYSVHHIGTTGWGWNTRIVEKVGPIYNYSVAATAYFLPVKMDYCGMLPDEISEGGP
ncbi:MAG TPA: hypothetical protein VD905_08805, partial [Flavobacteriales bacterium]|nr:hypothetical protein [Flavobacteriales bacterium]